MKISHRQIMVLRQYLFGRADGSPELNSRLIIHPISILNREIDRKRLSELFWRDIQPFQQNLPGNIPSIPLAHRVVITQLPVRRLKHGVDLVCRRNELPNLFFLEIINRVDDKKIQVLILVKSLLFSFFEKSLVMVSPDTKPAIRPRGILLDATFGFNVVAVLSFGECTIPWLSRKPSEPRIPTDDSLRQQFSIVPSF